MKSTYVDMSQNQESLLILMLLGNLVCAATPYRELAERVQLKNEGDGNIGYCCWCFETHGFKCLALGSQPPPALTRQSLSVPIC